MSGLEFGERLFCRVKLAKTAAQHGVHEARLRAKAVPFGQFDRFVDGGVIGDAAEPENLVEAEPQQNLERGFLRATGGLARDEPVERGLPAHDSVSQFLAKSAVGGRKTGAR